MIINKTIEQFFSDIIYVNSNPANIKIIKKSKVGDNIIEDKVEFKIKLKKTKINKVDDNFLTRKILFEMIKGNSEVIKIKSNSLFERLFISKFKNLKIKLKEILNDNNYIIVDSDFKNVKKLNLNNKIYRVDGIDCIIIGEKTNFYIKEFNINEIEYFFDSKLFKIIEIQ